MTMLASNRQTRLSPSIELLIIGVFVLLAGSLWIDMLTGFMSLELHLDLKLSLLYKMLLILLIFNLLGAMSSSSTLLLLALLIGLLIPAVTMFVRFSQQAMLLQDISAALKLFVPIFALSFFYQLSKYQPQLLKKWGEIVLWFNFLALNINLLVGTFGFGYKSYVIGKNGAGIGVNGYYTAGNELGGVFVLLFTFALARVWDKKRRFYAPLAILAIVWGLLIATKTAILSALLLVVFVPLISERNRLFKLTPLKLTLFSLSLLFCMFIAFTILPLLSSLALWDRFLWIYDNRGLMGLIFSGREQFSHDLLQAFFHQFGVLQWLFGAGISGIGEYVQKVSAEVDFIDVFVWFGCFGVFVIFVTLFLFGWHSYQGVKLTKSQYAPAAFLANTVLLLLTIFSGHIITSGMLGFIWALLNALVFIDLQQPKKLEY